MDAGDATAAGHVEHVAAAEELLGAAFAEDRAAVDLRGDLKADPGREIRLDRAGDHIDRRALRRHDDVDAGGARHLRQTLDRRLDVLAGDQHQIGHLVDDDDDQRQFAGVEGLRLEDRLAGLGIEAGLHLADQAFALGRRFGEPGVEPVDVAHAELRHLAIAVLHLAHRPFQRQNGLARIGDDRREQMRDAVIDRQLQHFRIDHDEFAAVGRHPVQDRQDHRVDADRLARPGGAGDQQMRHPGEVGQHRLAGNVLAEDQGEPARMLFIDRRIEQFAQKHRLGPAVRQFDADHGASRHDRDADRDGAHRAGDVVGQADDPRRLDSGRRLELVQGHHRAGTDLHDLAAHAVILEHGFEHAGVLCERLLVDRGGLGGRRLVQQFERGQHRLLVGDEVEPGLALFFAAPARRRRSRRRGDEPDQAGPLAFLVIGLRRWRAVEPRLAPFRQPGDDLPRARLGPQRRRDRRCRSRSCHQRRSSRPPNPAAATAPRPERTATSPGAAAGARAEIAPVAPGKSEDQQQRQAEPGRRHHRDRQCRRAEPGHASTAAAAPSRRRRRSPARHKAPPGREPTAPAPPEPAPPAAIRACARTTAADGPATAATTSRTARAGSQRRRGRGSGAGCRRARRRHGRENYAPPNRSPYPATDPAGCRKTAPPPPAGRPATGQSPGSRRRAASAPPAPLSRRAGGDRPHPPTNRSIWPCFPRCRPAPKTRAVADHTAAAQLYVITARRETARCRIGLAGRNPAGAPRLILCR